MSEKRYLSGADVEKLLKDPSAGHRADTAAKVSAEFGAGDLSVEERQIAEDIFRALIHDVEVRVRKALSDSLKDNPEVPHDVAVSLSHDVAEVALPMIEHSIVLSDEDLFEIITTQDEERQTAVAKRAQISESVADALVETKNENVVAVLVENDGAEISEGSLNRVLDDFGDHERINAPMAKRKKLPLRVAERLVTYVSESLKDHLVAHHELPSDVATDLLISCRERATVSLLGTKTDAPDVIALVDQLHRNKRLTPTIVMRALCMGDTTFFEAALAKKAGIPVANAYQLIHDRGELGLASTFDRCGMPPEMLPIARAALSVAVEMSVTSGDDRERFKHLMIERVLTKCEDDFDPENFDYLIGKLGATTSAAA